MNRTLVRKELAAHKLQFLALFLLAGGALLLLLLGGVADDAPYVGLQTFLQRVAPIVGFVAVEFGVL